MSLNQPSRWQHTCQQQNTVPTTPTHLELVPDRASDVEFCTTEIWRRTQEELSWYRNLYENTPSVYLTLDNTGIILSVNKFGANSLGYSPEELIKKSVYNLFPQLEQQRLFDALMELLTSPQESEFVNLEFRLNCPTSKMQWVKVVARRLHTGQENPLILMVCEDITAHKLSDEALQESEQHFQIMANIAPAMLWMAKPDGLCNFFNQSWIDFTGCNREQQQGFGWLDGVHPEDKNLCQQTYESAFITRTKFQMEYRLKRADGEYRWILNTGIPRFTPSDSFVGFIGCAIDITERKLAEFALQASQKAIQAQLEEIQSFNRIKDEFLSTVSHELRTPLTNMKMAIQMLEIALNQKHNLVSEMALPYAERSKVARYFQILNNECEREINLINNFLDLQKLDTNPKPLVLETIQVKQWLERVVELFKARNRNSWLHELQLSIAPNIPPLTCDPFSLERILIELLTNACKFSPPGAKIIVAAQLKSNFIQLQVSNYGVEIPASELPRIFDKFYRIPSNDPWKQGGTGLGLALVEKLTKSLGGTIQVESGSNRTCLTIQLPL